MNRYHSIVGQSDIKDMIDNVLKSFKTLAVHPFVFFYKFMLFLHQSDDDILGQHIFETIRPLLFK